MFKVALFLLAVSFVFSNCCLGDEIVTQKGERLQGQIVDKGRFYKVTLESGSTRFVFKKDVKEIVDQAAAEKSFNSFKTTADLSRDSDVEKLAKLAEAAQMQKVFKPMLMEAFQIRRKASRDIVALRKLAEWCQQYGLTKERDIYNRAAARMDFQIRLKKLSGKSADLGRLAIEYGEMGLTEESKQAETAALKSNPNDPQMRELLGYERDARGQWAKLPSLWNLKVQRAEGMLIYKEENGGVELDVKPAKRGDRLILVNARFKSTRAPNKSDQKQLDDVMSSLNTPAKKVVREMLKVHKYPASSQLFASSSAVLYLSDGTKAYPIFTTYPKGVRGTTIAGGGFTIVGGRSSNGIHYCLRLDELTMLAIEPKKEVELGLLYSVPKAATTGSLRIGKSEQVRVKW